jgi:hypothetical protein
MNHRGMPRGFLPWGLSNTCPQDGGMRASVACHGQVSDNPKHRWSLAKGGFLALLPPISHPRERLRRCRVRMRECKQIRILRRAAQQSACYRTPAVAHARVGN